MSDQANPLKTGSSVIGQAPSIAAPAVRRIGRNRTATALDQCFFQARPALANVLNKVEQQNRVAVGDTGQGDHANHRGSGEVHRLAYPPTVLPIDTL